MKYEGYEGDKKAVCTLSRQHPSLKWLAVGYSIKLDLRGFMLSDHRAGWASYILPHKPCWHTFLKRSYHQDRLLLSPVEYLEKNNRDVSKSGWLCAKRWCWQKSWDSESFARLWILLPSYLIMIPAQSSWIKDSWLVSSQCFWGHISYLNAGVICELFRWCFESKVNHHPSQGAKPW